MSAGALRRCTTAALIGSAVLLLVGCPGPTPAQRAEHQRQYEDIARRCGAAARRSWPQARERFVRGLPPGDRLWVRAGRSDSASGEQLLFLDVERIEGDSITGRPWGGGDRSGIDTLRLVTVAEAHLVEWAIRHPDGSEEGNHFRQYMDAAMKLKAEPLDICPVTYE